MSHFLFFIKKIAAYENYYYKVDKYYYYIYNIYGDKNGSFQSNIEYKKQKGS